MAILPAGPVAVGWLTGGGWPTRSMGKGITDVKNVGEASSLRSRWKISSFGS